MPNNTMNTVTVSGNKKAIAQFKHDVLENGMFKMVVLAPRDASFKEDDWYAWNIRNWGTKWEVYNMKPGYVSDTMLSFIFDTAWDAPMKYIEKLHTYVSNTNPTLELEWVAMDEDGLVPYRVLPGGGRVDCDGGAATLQWRKSHDSDEIIELVVNGLRGAVEDGAVNPYWYSHEKHTIVVDPDGNVTAGGNLIVDFNDDDKVHTLADCKYTHTLVCTYKGTYMTYYFNIRDMKTVSIEGPSEH